MRQDFVANTSHELKTPVGAVSLLAEAIESAADDPDQVRSFTARLSAEAARLSRLTARIMSLSRLQSADELAEVRDVPSTRSSPRPSSPTPCRPTPPAWSSPAAAIAALRARRRAGPDRRGRQPPRERDRLLAAGIPRRRRRELHTGCRRDRRDRPGHRHRRGRPASACSSASTAPTRPGPAAPAARASVSPSSSTPCTATTARCSCGPAPAGDRRSRSGCRAARRPSTSRRQEAPQRQAEEGRPQADRAEAREAPNPRTRRPRDHRANADDPEPQKTVNGDPA